MMEATFGRASTFVVIFTRRKRWRDLAVEVISEANTKKEMERKLREYFTAGVRLVWLIYPKTRTVEVYTSATECRRVRHDQTLDGGDVLPGFELPLRKLFARANGRRQAKK